MYLPPPSNRSSSHSQSRSSFARPGARSGRAITLRRCRSHPHTSSALIHPLIHLPCKLSPATRRFPRGIPRLALAARPLLPRPLELMPALKFLRRVVGGVHFPHLPPG